MVSALANALFAADVVHLSSDHLDLTYDPDAGGMTLRAPRGVPLVRNASAAAVLGAGETSVTDRRYIRRHERAASPEPLLPGEQLTIFCKDQRGQLDLEHRLLRYPCSYMIYSDAFDGWPAAAREAVYRRMYAVLSGADETTRYSRLSPSDRRAIIDILRETKRDLPAYFR